MFGRYFIIYEHFQEDIDKYHKKSILSKWKKDRNYLHSFALFFSFYNCRAIVDINTIKIKERI
jgi:hypothetical protein